MSAPSYESLLEQEPVDGTTVMREAIHFARRERKLEARVFGRRQSSLYDVAKTGIRIALDRELVRRSNRAGEKYRAALDPIAREIRQHELQITFIKDRLIGLNSVDRRYLEGRMNGHIERLAELKRPFAEAAE